MRVNVDGQSGQTKKLAAQRADIDTALDPLYGVLLAMRNGDTKAEHQLGKAALASDRLQRAAKYIGYKYQCDADDVAQDMLIGAIKLVKNDRKNMAKEIKSEKAFYSYLMTSAVNAWRKENGSVEGYSIPLHEAMEQGGLHEYEFFTDGQNLDPLDIRDDEQLNEKRAKIQAYMRGGGSRSTKNIDASHGNSEQLGSQSMDMSNAALAPYSQLFSITHLRVDRARRDEQIDLPVRANAKGPRLIPTAAEYVNSFKDHQELRESWKKSSLTLEAFAKAIQVEFGTLKSYIYIQAASLEARIPPAVMRRTRAFMRLRARDMELLSDLYSVSTAKTMDRWRSEICGDPKFSNTRMAKIIGLDDWTLYRWERGQSKPRHTKLAKAEALLREHFKLKNKKMA